MNREDSAKVGGWLDHAAKMARAVEQHGAEEAITALTEERDNALAALRRRSAQRDQLDTRVEELVDERDAATARAERAETERDELRRAQEAHEGELGDMRAELSGAQADTDTAAAGWNQALREAAALRRQVDAVRALAKGWIKDGPDGAPRILAERVLAALDGPTDTEGQNRGE